MRCRFALLAALLWAGGCRRGTESGFQRLLIPHFENLTGEPRYESWGWALAELLAEAVTGSQVAHPLRAESWWEAPAVRATHVLHGSFMRQGERLRIEAVLEDVNRRQIRRRWAVEGDPSEGPAPPADRLAAQLGLRARSVAHRDARALEAYRTALRSVDPRPLLEQAVAADPGFFAAYAALAQLHLARGDRESASAVLGKALRADVDPVSRHRAELMLAGIRGDAAAQEQALRALARLTPADPEVFQGLAVRALAARNYEGAARAYQEALARDPESGALLNQAAYALAYDGRFEEALGLLLRYRQLQPADPNPPDSLGDVHFQKGDFSAAESHYLESAQMSREFAGAGALYKAAWARWLQGDRDGADRHMAEYLAAREKARDPFLEIRRAQWEYLTGRSRRATARLLAFAAGTAPGELRALTFGFLAAWSLEAGDRGQARRHAAEAGTAGTPQARELARVCAFLAQDDAPPAEWARRAEASFPHAGEAGLRDTALAYALLLGGRLREAFPLLRSLLERTPPSPGEILPSLLAWAATESQQDARPWLRRWPTPVAGFPQPFDFLAWPRVIYLQGRRAEVEGAGERSLMLYRLFLKQIGDRPGHGEERRRAQAASAVP